MIVDDIAVREHDVRQREGIFRSSLSSCGTLENFVERVVDVFDTVLTFFPLLWGCCFGCGPFLFGTKAWVPDTKVEESVKLR